MIIFDIEAAPVDCPYDNKEFLVLSFAQWRKRDAEYSVNRYQLEHTATSGLFSPIFVTTGDYGISKIIQKNGNGYTHKKR